MPVPLSRVVISPACLVRSTGGDRAAPHSKIVDPGLLDAQASADSQDRLFAEVRRVLKPGAALIASDNLASAELEANHDDDTYNPIAPDTLTGRLEAVGFRDRGHDQPVRVAGGRLRLIGAEVSGAMA